MGSNPTPSAHARSASQMEFGEPPHSGGDSHGGIQNAVAFPCGNATPCARLRRARVAFFVKSNLVEIVSKSQNPFQTASDLMRTRRVRCIAYRQGTPRFRTNAGTARRREAAATPKETAPCISDSAGVRACKKWKGRFLSGFCLSGRGGANASHTGYVRRSTQIQAVSRHPIIIKE